MDALVGSVVTIDPERHGSLLLKSALASIVAESTGLWLAAWPSGEQTTRISPGSPVLVLLSLVFTRRTRGFFSAARMKHFQGVR
jgi:hypothetical protein